jgi:GNAT superfamily N-acetyltransferase
VRDENKQIVGGLKGYCYGNAFFVDILFMDEQLRGKGYGTQLMKLAEHEAKMNACDFVHLDTFSFQALPFYQKLGYIVYAELGYTADIMRFYLKKDI